MSYLLTFFLPHSAINSDSLKEVERQVGEIKGDKLFLLIESSGGDPLSAVQIIRFLQDRFVEVDILIPNFAMSAATLMSLGGNSIYMNRKSVLGPLDLQIEHPKDGNKISILDMRNILFNFHGLLAQLQYNNYLQCRNMGLTKNEAVKHSFSAANEFFKPLLDQIDPVYIQKSFRETDLALSYGKQLLSDRMMKDKPLQIQRTLTSLVNDYTSHGYGISPKEAKEDLKLNIKILNDLIEWSSIRNEYSILVNKNQPVIIFTELGNSTNETKKSNKKTK